MNEEQRRDLIVFLTAAQREQDPFDFDAMFAEWSEQIDRSEQNRRRYEERQEIKRQKKLARKRYVYLVSSEQGIYKIGCTSRLRPRIRELEDQYCVKLQLIHAIRTNNQYEAERILHKQYEHHRVWDEWFALTPEEVEEIKAISEM